MDRRETLKSMLIGGLAGSGLILSGCQPGSDEHPTSETSGDGDYGRTEKEKARDARIKGESFFTPHEMATIGVLCGLILPASATAGSALDAGVPEFIMFIANDMPSHQLPLRGGLMWLDHRALQLHNNAFKDCTESQQKAMLDEIAWPSEAAPEVQQGVKFFSLMRNLVLTGYYTSKMGIEDLGYQGNTPNVWDGVPEDVLAAHGLAYEPEWLAKCVNQDKRAELAQWDEEGQLLQ